jgi:cytoskeletal protein RodZ
MDVGLELRRTRERLGISLQQLSSTTKISTHNLQALEASDADRLPALVFTRGFVRAYAAEVGLDPDDTLRRYLEQFETPATPDAAVEEEPEPQPAASRFDAGRFSPGRVLRGRFGTSIVLALVCVAIFALAASQRQQHRQAAVSQPPPVATAGLVPSGPVQPAAVGTSGTAPGPADSLHIAIAPTGPCWVQAAVDDTRVFAAMLNAGDRRTIDSSTAVGLRVGDPASFAFTINGKPARIPGAAGQAVTVRITRENYAQFLR